MKKIKLSKNYIALIDDYEYEKINRYKWYAHTIFNKRTVYAVRHDNKNKKRSLIFMHHEIFGKDNNFIVDHIDGNGLNNTKQNLRFCTTRENAFNRKLYVSNKSGYKGVYWDKKANKWRSCIRVDKKLINIGYFNCLIKAVKSYNEMAIKYFKNFANLNKI